MNIFQQLEHVSKDLHILRTWLSKNDVPPKFVGTLWWTYKIAIENGPVEIVDFPMKHGGSFH